MKVWLPTIRAGTGADVYAERMAAGLERRGIQACVTWHNRCFELFPSLLGCVPLPPQTDIILANSWYGYAFRRKGIKLVITVYHCVHDAAYAPFRSLLQKIYHDTWIYFHESRSLKSADRIVAISNYTAASVKKIFTGCDPVVIYPGIDTGFFRPGQRARNDGKFRLLFVGTSSRRKGFDLLAPIMRRLGDGFSLSYTGHAPPGKHRGTDNIRGLGKLSKDALLLAYQECDALLFPTRFEGFGYVVCEAMACGKPVITSDNSSLPELVRHDVTGILCKTDDIDAFVDAARLLAANPELAKRMGEAGRERVLQNFTLEKMTDAYIRLYEEVLSS